MTASDPTPDAMRGIRRGLAIALALWGLIAWIIC